MWLMQVWRKPTWSRQGVVVSLVDRVNRNYGMEWAVVSSSVVYGRVEVMITKFGIVDEPRWRDERGVWVWKPKRRCSRRSCCSCDYWCLRCGFDDCYWHQFGGVKVMMKVSVAYAPVYPTISSAVLWRFGLYCDDKSCAVALSVGQYNGFLGLFVLECVNVTSRLAS